MSTHDEARLGALAEAIVFAHEAETPWTPEARDTDARAFERAAALAASALAEASPPPSALMTRLSAAGLEFCAAARPRASEPRGPAPGFTTPVRAPRSGQLLPFLLGAAAASLFLWLTLLRHDGGSEDLRALRERTLAKDRTAVQRVWQPGPSPLRGDVQGDVVWSQERQDGWLTFRGLPPLDADHAYQLWIVDEAREGAPVDGGLFHIGDAGADTLVPIHATLPIHKPAAFVVTVEEKDGVVVSKREHIVAIASL